MATQIDSALLSWTPAPVAARLIADRLDALRQESAFLRSFETRLREETGTRLLDWTDRLFTNDSTAVLTAAGFKENLRTTVWRHDNALLPAVAIGTDGLAIRVESVVDFLSAQGLDDRVSIVGDCGAAVRRACINEENGVRVFVIESHGTQDWDPGEDSPPINLVTRHLEAFRLRQRDFADDADGFQHAETLIHAATDDLGRDRACDLFFMAERGYWQRRNRAARVQWARQAAIGLGWANHDHHTYRCSRTAFAPLVRLLELLGFECRERFYAGSEAGWGAQVLEQPQARIVVFADVDLSAEEVAGDFAHEPLADRAPLGTVGLWCRLHGEAFLTAGMHHLECQFDFDQARKQLADLGVSTMAPFTDLSHLRQAFTTGEFWHVEERRLASALQAGVITGPQADTFRESGVLGSHLEILERNDGYKGFNQAGISDIILQTDPRAQA